MEIISTTVTIYSFLNEHAVIKSFLQLAHFHSNFIIYLMKQMAKGKCTPMCDRQVKQNIIYISIKFAKKQ